MSIYHNELVFGALLCIIYEVNLVLINKSLHKFLNACFCCDFCYLAHVRRKLVSCIDYCQQVLLTNKKVTRTVIPKTIEVFV